MPSITEETLKSELSELESMRIKELANLHAIEGAMQIINKLLGLLNEKEKSN